MSDALALDVPPRAPWPKRLVRSSFGRILVYILLAVAIGFPLSLALRAVGWDERTADPALRTFSILLKQVVPTLGAYLLLVRFVERRFPGELLPRPWAKHFALGLSLSVLLIGSVMAAMWLAGAWHVNGFNSDVRWLFTLVVPGIGAALAEELMFRGVLFRIIEEAGGTWWALGVSALLFGGVHSWNPGATLWSSFAIAVEAGVLLGVVYHVWKSLPVCIGLHLGWNFIEGAVLGSAVSGHAQKGWLDSQFSGSDWLTGGGFGIEASVITVAVSLALSGALLAMRLPDRARGR